jgi:DNA-binding LacI/PurR family transcriptional regulator
MAVGEKKVTMRDIAEQVGVSRQAVSTVLNNLPNCRVSKEKRKQIESLAEKLNYRKNFGVKLLRQEKTPTVVIAYTRMQEQEHIKKLILQLSQKFDLNGYALYLLKMTQSAEYNINRIYDMIARGCSYFVFVTGTIGSEKIYDIIKQHNLNYVGYGTYCGRDIVADAGKARLELIEYCRRKSNGNYKIIYPKSDFLKNELPPFMPDIYEDENVIVTTPVIGQNVEEWFRTGARYTEQVMLEYPETTAIAYFSDYFAVGGCRQLMDMGYIPGKDVIITGLNNLMPCCLAFPICSADHDVETISELMYSRVFDNEPFSIKTEMKMFYR